VEPPHASAASDQCAVDLDAQPDEAEPKDPLYSQMALKSTMDPNPLSQLGDNQ